MTAVGATTEVILTGGNIITVMLPAPLMQQALDQAVKQQMMFIGLPQLAGDIIVSIGHIAAIRPKLAGQPAPATEERPIASKLEVAK